MPKYFYRCDHCEHEFETFHSIKDILIKCETCDEESLVRVPQQVLNNIKTKEQKTGTIVNQYIKDAKQDLQHQKHEMKNEIYNDD